MKEFDFAGALDGEAAGAIRLQDILAPDVIASAREHLERLGYKRV